MVVVVVVVVAARGRRVLQSRQQSQMRWGSVAAEGLGAGGQSMGWTYCWQETAPMSTMLRCSGLLGQAMGWVRWCRLWDIGVRCRTVVVVSWLLQTDSDGIPYHAYLGTRAADIHIKTHIHTAAPINRSISQSARPCFSPSQVSRGRSSRIVSGAPPVSTTQRAAASSLHPVAWPTYRCPCQLRCRVATLSAPSPFTWASVDGPELDEHAPCGRSLGVSE